MAVDEKLRQAVERSATLIKRLSRMQIETEEAGEETETEEKPKPSGEEETTKR
jgi:hypothetical protein